MECYETMSDASEMSPPPTPPPSPVRIKPVVTVRCSEIVGMKRSYLVNWMTSVAHAMRLPVHVLDMAVVLTDICLQKGSVFVARDVSALVMASACLTVSSKWENADGLKPVHMALLDPVNLDSRSVANAEVNVMIAVDYRMSCIQTDACGSIFLYHLVREFDLGRDIDHSACYVFEMTMMKDEFRSTEDHRAVATACYVFGILMCTTPSCLHGVCKVGDIERVSKCSWDVISSWLVEIQRLFLSVCASADDGKGFSVSARYPMASRIRYTKDGWFVKKF